MSSANRYILTVSLPICIPFIPSSCLIALARNSSTNNRAILKKIVSTNEANDVSQDLRSPFFFFFRMSTFLGLSVCILFLWKTFSECQEKKKFSPAALLS
jgi:hypothetical protein